MNVEAKQSDHGAAVARPLAAGHLQFHGAAGAELAGQKSFINIEGQEYLWNKPTITVQEIRQLGNLPTDMPVVCEDVEGHERTLAEDEIVTIKPGHRHGRAPKYKRG